MLNSKRGRYPRPAVCGVVFIIISVCALFVYSWLQDPRARKKKTEIHFAEHLTVGSQVLCETVVRLPWFRWPLGGAKIEFHDNDAAAMIHSPRPELVRVGAGVWDWRIRAVWQAYQPGVIENWRKLIHVVPRRKGDEHTLEIRMEPIHVRSMLDRAPRDGRLLPPPVPAAPEPPPRPPWRDVKVILVIIITLVAISSLIFPRHRRRQIPAEASPEEKALRRIEKLSRDNDRSMNQRLTLLSDIIKAYLEERWMLNTDTVASLELMSKMEKQQTLSEPQKRFLEHLLLTTDQVKFGGAEISPEEWRRIASESRLFVAAAMKLE